MPHGKPPVTQGSDEKQFAELVEVKHKASMVNGFLADQIIPTIQSPFTMTNVVLTASSINPVWSRRLSVQSLAAGE